MRANLKVPQFLKNRKIRAIAQMLTQGYMGDGGSGWWAPDSNQISMLERIVHLPSKLLIKEIIFKDYSFQCNFLQCGMTAVLPQASHTHDSRNRSNVKLMIYVHISSKTWLPEVRGVMLHIGPLRILALYKASIVWNLKQRWLKSRNEIKCYFC